MKKLLSLAFAILLISCLLVSCGNDPDVPDGMKLASGDAVAYDLFIPEEWLVDVQTGYTSAHVSDTDATNVSVTSFDMQAANSTVDDWWEINVTDLKVAFTDYKEMKIGADTVLGGESAKEYVYSAKLGGVEYVYHHVAAVVEGGIVYNVTYTTTPDKYESSLETFNKITSEFRFR